MKLLYPFILSCLLLFSCTRKLNLARYLKDKPENSYVFHRLGTQHNSNTFAGAINNKQVNYLLKNYKARLYTGTYGGAQEDGLYIIQRHRVKEITNERIVQSNIRDLQDSLGRYTRYTRVADRYFIDSLSKTGIIYFWLGDTSQYKGVELLTIHYVNGSIHPNGNEYRTIDRTNDSIVSFYKEKYPLQNCWVKSVYNNRDGNVELVLGIYANKPNELSTFEKELRTTVKSVKKIAGQEFEERTYLVTYFVPEA